MTRKLEVEWFTVISKKPFDEVVATIKVAIGHPNMVEFWQPRTTTAEVAGFLNGFQVPGMKRIPILANRGCQVYAES